MKKFHVGKEYTGLRLDVFLHSQYLDFSRAWIQKLIKKGNAGVNPALARKNGKSNKNLTAYKLKAGDVIEFTPEFPPEISLEPDKSLSDKIEIIFEDEDFIIINKPNGISVHPSSSETKGTVVNWLIYHFPKIKSVGDSLENGNIRPGIVHRLDKETSGVMAIAKNQKAFLLLKKQFQDHTVTKKYVALVDGSPKEDSGKIDLNIARSKTDPTKNVAIKSKKEGRRALTYWIVIKRYADHTLLEVAPKTGRMHQIRVHLKSMGLPVAGDKKYANSGTKNKNPKHLGRMFLHAEYLSFKNANDEKMSFSSPLPSDLANCLHNLIYVIK
jgi:23S rRNA pseudouridine1911/1915/1917 synthase